MEEAHAQQAGVQAESNAGLPNLSKSQTSPEVTKTYERQLLESRTETAPVKVVERETAVAVAEPEMIDTESDTQEAAPAELATLLPGWKPEPPKPDPEASDLEEDAGKAASSDTSSTVEDRSLDKLRDAIVQTLDDRGHQTASALVGAGRWRQIGDTVEVQVAVKKLMLGLVMNPEADRLAKGVMREMGLPPKLSVVPGEGGTGSPTTRPVPQGSVQAQAMENPLVKQAQELFRAEVRSILDLRDKR